MANTLQTRKDIHYEGGPRVPKAVVLIKFVKKQGHDPRASFVSKFPI